MSSNKLSWKLVSSKVIKDYKVLRVVEILLEHPQNGIKHSFITFESNEWVNIVPLTPSLEVVTIRQHRAGTKRVSLEIPGGLVDPGETPLESAKRELEEETGFNSDHWIYLGVNEPNPALFTNLCHTFLALNCLKSGNRHLDPREVIESELIPLKDIPNLIGREIKHALVIVAFHFLFQKYPEILQGKMPDLPDRLNLNI
ncbi:MAG: NUDIX hydrolase [Promethearchaeota archaeon]